jgi:hypothetical protein
VVSPTDFWELPVLQKEVPNGCLLHYCKFQQSRKKLKLYIHTDVKYRIQQEGSSFVV